MPRTSRLRAGGGGDEWGWSEFHRRVLATGAGGTGTAFVAQVLRSHGLAVTHDVALGADGIVTNACDGQFVSIHHFGRHDDPDYVVAKLNVKEFEHVIHLVREPMLVLGSLMAKWASWGHVWSHVTEAYPEVAAASQNPLRAAGLYWDLHNARLEEVATSRLQVEAITRDPGLLLAAIGVDGPVRVLSDRPNRSGAASYPSWTDLEAADPSVADRIAARALRYGYAHER